MGILSIFTDDDKHIKKIETLKVQLGNSFLNIRKDIELQNKWINFLNQNHTNLKTHHDSHKEITAKQLDNLSQWIKHLHENTKQHQGRVQELETHLQKAFKLYNEHIIEMNKKINHVMQIQSQVQTVNPEAIKRQAVNESLITVEHSLSSLKQQFSDELKQLDGIMKKQQQQVHDLIKKELTDILAATPQPQPRIIHDDQKVILPQQYIPNYSYDLLTNPEKKLLSIMFNEAEPLTYEQISHKTGHSINTVRVNMNILKKKGIIEEHLLPSGVKLFALSNKEKIKKMYNLEVM